MLVVLVLTVVQVLVTFISTTAHATTTGVFVDICIWTPVTGTPIPITTEPELDCIKLVLTNTSVAITIDSSPKAVCNKLVVKFTSAFAVMVSLPKAVCNKLVVKLTLASAVITSSPNEVCIKFVDNVAIVTAWVSTLLTNVLNCEPTKITVTGISIVTLLSVVSSSCSAPAARDTLPPASIETLSIVNCNKLEVKVWSKMSKNYKE